MNFNSNNKGLNVLKEAFREINKWEYENLHLETLEEVIPSPAYIKRMERLIQWQKRSCWKYVNSIGKRIAMIAVAIALTFGLSMSVCAVRKPVVEFFVNMYEKFVEFFYDDDVSAKAPSTIETVYTLGYVPEGYELESCSIEKMATCFIWINEVGEQIVFSQGLLCEYSLMDNENSNYEIMSVNDITMAVLEKDSIRYCYWSTKNYRFILYMPSDISSDVFDSLINSIIKYEK
jgi:hypothetical protein